MTQDDEMGNLDQSLNNDPRLATILKLPRPVRAKVVGCALAGLLALGSLGGVLAQVEVSSSNRSPATGHAQVIAHGVVDLGDGEVNWKVAPAEAGATAAEVPYGDSAGFILASDGAVLITEAEFGDLTALAPGEAAVRRADDDLAARAMADDESEYIVLSIGQPSTGRASGPDFVTPSFEVAGLRDINLVRDVLDEDESSRVLTSSLPTLVVVTEGEIEIETDQSKPRTLSAGESVLVPGPFEVEATEAGTAFVAAVISEEFEGSGQAATPVATGNTLPGATPVADVDSDSDGLFDNDETGNYGTDPQDADTDDDGLPDGDEVTTYGSSPTDQDTDDDLLPDYNEVTQHATDPADPDTDDDNYSDHDELGVPTDPLDPDSDGDGLLDGDELLTYGSNPNDTDSDDDGLLDGDEINLYGSSPASIDTDGDLLPDFNEATQHNTNPANPDTDGDGVNDHDELNAGTDPLDPGST